MTQQPKQQPPIYRQSQYQMLNGRLLNIQPQHHSSLNKQIVSPPDLTQKLKQRLSLRDIQNITKSMMKDRKAHEQNVGVLNYIKGQISNFKQFSHYFYTSQYRRKISKPQSQNLTNYHFLPTNRKNMRPKHYRKINTQPSQINSKTQYPLDNITIPQLVSSKSKQINNNTNYDFNYNFQDNQEQIKKIQKIMDNQNAIEDLRIDEKLKTRVHQMVLPILNNMFKQNAKGKQGVQITEGKQLRASMDRCREEKKYWKGHSNSRIL